MLDPADCALVHTIDSGKLPYTLTPRQGQSDLTNLSILDPRTRVAVSPHTPPVPQAVDRVAMVIAEIQVVRPVVTRIIIMVADELVPVELPTQDQGCLITRPLPFPPGTRKCNG